MKSLSVFSGRVSFSRSTPESLVELISWASDDETLSRRAGLGIASPEFSTKIYVRVVTSGNNHCPLPRFGLHPLPLAIILGIDGGSSHGSGHRAVSGAALQEKKEGTERERSKYHKSRHGPVICAIGAICS